jgi:hypothetical protein
LWKNVLGVTPSRDYDAWGLQTAMPHQNQIVLKIGGSRERADFRFTADEETLKRIARQILDCMENGKAGPWGNSSNVVAMEEVQWEGKGFFGKSVETAFLSFEKN